MKVYKNLTRGCYSLKEDKVIGHCDRAMLTNVSFKISEATRQRVIREKKKYVHAYVVGELVSTNQDYDIANLTPISYNPYRAGYFFNKETGDRIDNCEYVVLTEKSLWAKI